MATTPEPRDRCCLCGKLKTQVRKLMIGLHGAVCGDCIELCRDILGRENLRITKTDEGGYTLEIPSDIAKTFPDPNDLNQIIQAVARSVDARARAIISSS